MREQGLVGEALKRSPLDAVHRVLHAKFGTFAGWELPIYYASILEEHRCVRERVGLFDVSHLGHLEVQGFGALRSLQRLVTQDLNRLAAGQALYTPMLNEQGAILDEMILYRLETDRFRLVVNAANGDKVLDWLKRHLDPPVKVEDLRERVGTLALQGPKAVEVLTQAAKEPLDRLARYRVRPASVSGRTLLVARTGYTGEDGFELFLEVEELASVWNALLKAGEPFGIRPIGLGARDTLRLEAGLPLGGADLDERSTPLEAGLEWTVDWSKGPFIGKEALVRQKESGLTRRLIGFELKGAGIPRHGYPILRVGRRIGQVTSGTALPRPSPSPPVGVGRVRGIGMGYVTPDAQQPGTDLMIEIHGRPIPAQVVKLPFYRRRSESRQPASQGAPPSGRLLRRQR